MGTKKITLVNRVPADLPTAVADESRLQQILLNLVGNAIKFTEVGRVEVSAYATGDRLAVSVTDTGIGIPESAPERIFESFEQADGGTERVYGGAGLGLSITKKLVELHEGKITVDSVPLEIRTPPSARSSGLHEVRDSAERDRIRQALEQTEWNVAGAARVLGIERTNLHKRMKALGLNRDS